MENITNVQNHDIDLNYNIEAISKELNTLILDDDNHLLKVNNNDYINYFNNDECNNNYDCYYGLQCDKSNPYFLMPTTSNHKYSNEQSTAYLQQDITKSELLTNNTTDSDSDTDMNTNAIDAMETNMNLQCISIFADNLISENGFCNIYPQPSRFRLPTIPLIAQIPRKNQQDRNSKRFCSTNNKCQLSKTEKLSPLYLKNDVVHIDLSKLDMINIRKESNELMRLFRSFREIYNAIAEIPPTPKSTASNLTVDTFTFTPITAMLNKKLVCSHIKNAIAAVFNFINAIKDTLNSIGVVDYSSHVECECSLLSLGEYLLQLQNYENINFDYRNCLFVTNEIRVTAKNLEKLLEEIAREIRNLQMRITAYIWYSNDRLFGIQMQEDKPIDCRTLSMFGVINDILQMCNNSN